MIFVVLGTQDKKFERLLKEIEQLIIDGIIQGKVIVQAGSTNYKSNYMEIHKIISMNKFLNYVEKSDYIITHGGVGTILDAMKQNKRIIAVPRLKKYGEHENNHQIQIIQKFAQDEYLIGCNGIEDLKEAVQKIDQFEPKTCHFGNEQMLELITNYIETTDCDKKKNMMLNIFYVACATIVEILFYFFLRMKLNTMDAVSIAWAISYVLLVMFRYQFHRYFFEIIWFTFLAITLIVWFNLCNESLIAMLGGTFVANMITCISHNLFYKRRS